MKLSFDTIFRMAEVYSCEVGDLFPNTAPPSEEFESLAAALINVPTDQRRFLLKQLASTARAFAMAFSPVAPAKTNADA